MFKPKITIDKALFEKLKSCADLLGCSVDEYAAKVLERDADRELSKSGRHQVSQAEVDDIAQKLKGLGYLD